MGREERARKGTEERACNSRNEAETLLQAPLSRLYQDSIKALFRLYQCFIKALFRLYSGSIKALLRHYQGYIKAMLSLY